MKKFKVLAINPGSTSTKVALFEDDKEVFKKTVSHDAEELAKYPAVSDQLPYRRDTILAILEEEGIALEEIDAFAGRGGGLNACVGGTYEVNEKMLEHCSSGKYGGNHPAALGPQIAAEFAKKYNARAFIVNPPDVDEFCDDARITGFADVYRGSQIHALNQKETAIRVAADMGKKYEDVNFIVCHIGGGVSVTAHQKGKMIDSNSIINGEGPMAPTRSGSMPLVPFMDLCYSGKWTRDEMYKRITKTGGFVSHLGTSETTEVYEMAKSGKKYAKLILDAFIYQIGKEVGSMAAVLCGQIDAIILTGGIANNKELMAQLTDMIGFLGEVKICPGEFELEALAAGALRALKGEEELQVYTGEAPFKGFDKN